MVDRLAVLLERFSMRAQVFHAGALCGVNVLDGAGDAGQLHLVRRGPVEVFHDDLRHDGLRHGGGAPLRIEAPSLLLYPRPAAHRFVTDPERGADMVCAHLRFEGGAQNPVGAALPAVLCLPLSALAGTAEVLALLFEEAFAQRCGRHALVNRLFEVVMIQVLRQQMEHGHVHGGMLAGLSHPRLRNALVAMHESPARDWSLDALAAVAGMSRTAFATGFREVVGTPPGHYLQGWRVGLAQHALRQGRPLKIVAAEVGYGSEAALSRAFKACSGVSPRAWRKAQVSSAAESPATGS